MDNSKKKFIWIPLAIAVALICGIFIGRYFQSLNMNGAAFPFGNKLDNILQTISEEYVDTVDKAKIIEELIPELVGKLDPHSAYIPAEDFENVNDELEGKFSGIGVQFSLLKDTITVMSVISGGPSEKIGILPGDRIVTINDSVFVGKEITNEKVMKKLRGEKNTVVKLGIKRNTAKNLLSFDVTRGDIPINSVDVSYTLDNKNIGYIKISRFGRTTYDEMMNALAKLKKLGAKGYVIDLRGNSGGYLEAAINMVNEFLPKDRLIVYTEGKAFPRNDVYSDGRGTFQTVPLVVLVDESSASASEIFAGAVQDNDRGTIIGRRSFGKGLVQQQFPFKDGSALRLTVARYYTPSGRSIQKEYKMGQVEDYSQDLMNRFIHGEFDSADSIKMNQDLKYETINGRTVYGGGGIMPDIFIPRDTIGVTSYFNTVFNNGLIYQFAFEYFEQNKNALSKFKDYKSLLNYLETQPILEDFVYFAARNGVKPRPVYINISKSLLTNYLYAYIERNVLGDEAFYPVIFMNDNTINKAIEILKSGKSVPIDSSK